MSTGNVNPSTTAVSTGAVVAAPLLAGAWNWVVKDGIGQLGGVLVASRLSHFSKTLDADPKRWRMTAALSLDMAAGIEIVTPLAPSVWVLPLAVAANLLKNIGFLTASASRAALHQSLATAGNLADVTAKAGSQSMAAGTIGTFLGVGFSTSLATSSHAFAGFGTAFLGLACLHQGFHYISLRAVALRHMNRHRLNILLEQYVSSGNVLTPAAVAQRESIRPFLPTTEDTSNGNENWLSIGSDIPTILRGQMCDTLLEASRDHPYVLWTDDPSAGDTMLAASIHLTFMDQATGADLVKGMMHAWIMRDAIRASESTSESMSHGDALQRRRVVRQRVAEEFPIFLEELKDAGWTTDTNSTNIEPRRAVRLAVVYADVAESMTGKQSALGNYPT